MDAKRAWTNNELEDLLRQLGLALDVSGIGIWQHNIDKGHTRWDDQLTSIYQVAKGPDDVVWLDCVHPDDVVETNAVFLHAIDNKQDYSSDFRIVRPDGAVRHLRSRARYFVDAAGDACFVGAEWDVTDDVLLNMELERSRAAARFAADHDHLTGLLNRRSFDARLSALSERADVTVSLCHIDVDRFKEINDRFGHAGGDKVLCHLGAVLSKATGTEGVAARLGGDEFAILTDDDGAERPSADAMAAIMEALRQALEQPVFLEDEPFKIQCSMGIASAQGTDLDRLLPQSDVALYEAKRNGRNRSQIFSPAIADNLATERQTVDDLKAGLERGEILSFYQIEVDAKRFTITGAEALARWRHPSRGLLAPSEFLGLASQHGLVADIDEVIFSTVLSDMASWPVHGLPAPRVSVNLSADRLRDPLLPQKLGSAALPFQGIGFELSETMFSEVLNDPAKSHFAALRSLGIAVDIDDFGSGHTSLCGLVELRPDRLKLDHKLIAPILQSVATRRLVGSLVDIARTLDITVIAKGIETPEQAKVLQGLGVDLLQGHAFGPPEPHDLFRQRLRKIKADGRASA